MDSFAQNNVVSLTSSVWYLTLATCTVELGALGIDISTRDPSHDGFLHPVDTLLSQSVIVSLPANRGLRSCDALFRRCDGFDDRTEDTQLCPPAQKCLLGLLGLMMSSQMLLRSWSEPVQGHMLVLLSVYYTR